MKGATKMYFTDYSCVVDILFNTSLYKSVFSVYSFGKLVFCLSVLFVFFACSEFKVIFKNFCNIWINMIYVVGVRYSVFLFSFITSHFNSLWGQMSYYKKLIAALNKKDASRELLSFRNYIYKEKCGTFTKWEIVKETLSANIYIFWENLVSISFILNL